MQFTSYFLAFIAASTALALPTLGEYTFSIEKRMICTSNPNGTMTCQGRGPAGDLKSRAETSDIQKHMKCTSNPNGTMTCTGKQADSKLQGRAEEAELEKRMICTSNPNGTMTCQGKSGGPNM